MANTLGQRVKECRKEAKLTQVSVCAKVGISQATLSELENDEYPTSSFVPHLAKLFNVSAHWLATGEGEKRPKKPELSDLVLSVANELMQLPKEQQLKVRTWVSAELEAQERERSRLQAISEQDRNSSR